MTGNKADLLADLDTINSGVEVPVLLFEDCAFLRFRLHGVLLNMGYLSMRVKIR